MWKYIENIAVVVGLTQASIGIWDYIGKRNGVLERHRIELLRIQQLEAENRAQRQKKFSAEPYIRSKT